MSAVLIYFRSNVFFYYYLNSIVEIVIVLSVKLSK